jgi:LemA protein
MAYNTTREIFPDTIIAGMFSFQAAQLFEISKPDEREPVKVTF